MPVRVAETRLASWRWMPAPCVAASLLHRQRGLRDHGAGAGEQLDRVRLALRQALVLVDVDVAGEHAALGIDILEPLVGGERAALAEELELERAAAGSGQEGRVVEVPGGVVGGDRVADDLLELGCLDLRDRVLVVLALGELVLGHDELTAERGDHGAREISTREPTGQQRSGEHNSGCDPAGHAGPPREE